MHLRPVLIALFVFGCPLVHAAPTVVLSYTTTHVPEDEDASLVFPTGESEIYYTNALVAVVIEAVYADGINVTPATYDAAAHGEVDVKMFRPVLPSRMVYKLSGRNLISAKSRDIYGHLDFKRYEIPADSKKIEISYRIRYPNGKISQEMQLISVSSYEFKTVNDK